MLNPKPLLVLPLFQMVVCEPVVVAEYESADAPRWRWRGRRWRLWNRLGDAMLEEEELEGSFAVGDYRFAIGSRAGPREGVSHLTRLLESVGFLCVGEHVDRPSFRISL